MPTESTNNAYNLEVREDDTQGQTNNSAAFSPIITVGAFVFPDVTVGMLDASATRSPSMPWTLGSWSTTHIGPRASQTSVMGDRRFHHGGHGGTEKCGESG